jgi:hypothetical protein
VNHPEQAKRNRNTMSNTTSVPVGVKSKDILRVRSPAAISALSVAESYHTRKKICWIGSAGRSGQVERALLASCNGGSRAPNVRRDILSSVSSLVPQALIPRM